jgi:hypothetical protein
MAWVKMDEKKLSELTDAELLEEAKKIKPSKIIDAVLIGFMAGIIIYSAVMNTLGFLTLIPLFFIYLLLNKSKKHKAILKLLKERNLDQNSHQQSK